ncbi:MAG: peptidylprolyl isomerase [Phocaeicola sp.]
MPSRLTGIILLLLVPTLMVKAQEEVLLHINNSPITLSEFVYQYNKSTQTNIESFVTDFVDYKLQVHYALDKKIDTIASFRKQFDYYSQKLVDSYAPSNSNKIVGRQLESKTHSSYPNSKQWIKVASLTIPLLQSATGKETAEAMQLMQQIRRSCSDNISLVALSRSFSADISSKVGMHEFPWQPLTGFLQEWIDSFRNLQQGEISQPFISPIGIHIVQMVEISNTLPIEFNSVLNAPKLSTSITSSSQSSLSLDSLCGEIAIKYPEFKLRLQEVKEALLVASLKESTYSEKNRWTEEKLEEFFSKSKSEYNWEYPHYKGVVVHCKDKRLYKKWKKLLRKLPSSRWEEALRELTSFSPNSEILFETGLFQIGANKYVDKLVFHCGTSDLNVDYPFTFVLGKKLKGPESYQDVKEQLIRDYQKASEKLWIEAIRQHYKVELKEEVLKTVNNSASN